MVGTRVCVSGVRYRQRRPPSQPESVWECCLGWFRLSNLNIHIRKSSLLLHLNTSTTISAASSTQTCSPHSYSLVISPFSTCTTFSPLFYALLVIVFVFPCGSDIFFLVTASSERWVAEAWLEAPFALIQLPSMLILFFPHAKL